MKLYYGKIYPMIENGKNEGLKIANAIRICLQNADRLLHDCQYINEDYSLIKYLSIIAQEEIAKAFIIFMIKENVLTWAEAKIILRDHKSKQLLALIIDYLEPVLDEWRKRYSLANIGKTPNLPSDIVDAVNVIAKEKIKRIKRDDWIYDDKEIDSNVERLADGIFDIEKQNSLYVNINEDFTVLNDPRKTTEQSANVELKRAIRMKSIISISDGVIKGPEGIEYSLMRLTLMLALGKITVDNYLSKVKCNYWC